jgi:predicted dehydrogenase
MGILSMHKRESFPHPAVRIRPVSSACQTPISIAIMGYGFMGNLHARVFAKNPLAKVVAVIDSRMTEMIPEPDGSGPRFFPDYSSAAEAVDFEVLDICLPTDLHAGAACEAFADGRHVFCEKPIALTLGEADRMIAASRQAGRQLMIGHCLRFWPEYDALKTFCRNGELGGLRSLSLFRRAARPDYTAGDWANQPGRCLGAALDLHIHDTDILLDLLGTPAAVFSSGLRDKTGWSSIATHYLYDTLRVEAEGAWNFPPGWPFQMGFCAVFEKGVLDFDSTRENSLTVLRPDSGRSNVPVPSLSDGLPVAYVRELSHFLHGLADGEPVQTGSGPQARESLRVTLAEIESATRREPVSLSA